MLVLSRQRDETIMIGDDIEITVVDIRGEKVRLGINAPPHIPVHRKEVYEAIKRENQATAQAKGEPPHKVESLAQKRKPTESQPPPTAR
jgi:carbon storage regulator